MRFFIGCFFVLLFNPLNGQSQFWIEQVKLADSISDFDASRAMQIATRVLKASADPAINQKAMLVLNNAWFHKGDYQRSFLQLDSLSGVVNTSLDSTDYFKVSFMLGRRHHFRGEHAQALEVYFKILRYASRKNAVAQFAETSNIIGGIYLNQSDGVNAYNYYEQGLRIQIRNRNDYKIGRGYLNLGNALNLQQRYDQSRMMLDSSQYYYKKVKFNEGLSYVYATVAEIFTAKQKPDSALYYLLKSRNVVQDLRKLYALAQIDKDIAFQYYIIGDNESALYYGKEGLKVAEETGQVHNMAPLYKLLSEIEEKRGQANNALYYFKLYKLSSDSVLNASSIKKQTEAALQYEFNKRQIERDNEAEKERLLAEAESRQQRLIFIAVLAFVTLMAILLYFRYKIKQRANNELSKAYLLLEEKNKQIEQKSKELSSSLSDKEMLLKEIHHRVKNNLQVISGLLELQKEELLEEGSKAAFDEGQSRIKSISLIHQNLYQNDHLGSVKFNVFVQELVDQIQDLFEINSRNVAVEVEIPEVLIDIDRAVPLGLVLNELLTNSFKYAFHSESKGSIAIQLYNNEKDGFVLLYSDTGPGLPPGLELGKGTTLGLRLIRGLANQIHGMASYYYDKKAYFKITFPFHMED